MQKPLAPKAALNLTLRQLNFVKRAVTAEKKRIDFCALSPRGPIARRDIYRRQKICENILLILEKSAADLVTEHGRAQ